MSPTAANPTALAEDLATLTAPENIHGNTVLPATTAEVAAILRLADARSLPVEVQGANTKRTWGHAGKTGLLLKTTRLNRVLDHTWQDMTCTVEAGCPWSALQAALARHNQFVALDPLWPAHATVGGIASTNDSGALRLHYGSLRDLILGMTLVLADGTVARTGGKVVKNVAGYDLHKLVTGAFGTLAVITEVTFRLHALPRHTNTLTVASPTPEPLGHLLLAILDSRLSTQSLQLRSSLDAFHLDLRLAALPSVMDEQAGTLATLAHTHRLTPQPAEPSLWNARQDLMDTPGVTVLKATMLPTEIARFTAAIHALGGASATQATGIMTATLPTPDGVPTLRTSLETAQGSLTILRQPAPATLDPWGAPPDTLPLMREIKHRFDPNRILNPGRFLGGI